MAKTKNTKRSEPLRFRYPQAVYIFTNTEISSPEDVTTMDETRPIIAHSVNSDTLHEVKNRTKLSTSNWHNLKAESIEHMAKKENVEKQKMHDSNKLTN